MSKVNVLHAEIKAQRLSNLAIKDELDETRSERDAALGQVVRLRAIVLSTRSMTPEPTPDASE